MVSPTGLFSPPVGTVGHRRQPDTSPKEGRHSMAVSDRWILDRPESHRAVVMVGVGDNA